MGVLQNRRIYFGIMYNLPGNFEAICCNYETEKIYNINSIEITFLK